MYSGKCIIDMIFEILIEKLEVCISIIILYCDLFLDVSRRWIWGFWTGMFLSV